MEFSGVFKNLTTLVLHSVVVQQDLLQGLFSNCINLVNFTLDDCNFKSDLEIISPTLLHLNIVNWEVAHWRKRNIYIIASNLSSIEYTCNKGGAEHTMKIMEAQSCRMGKTFYVTAPRLLKVFWDAAKRQQNPVDLNASEAQENPDPFGPIASLRHIENLAMICSPSQIAKLRNVLVQLRNLKQLELCIEGAYDPNTKYLWILDIAMACQHLQKLSLTIRNSHLKNSHKIGIQRERRKVAGFFHNELKYVELRGCVCTINLIELASHLLRNVNSLKQMTFRSRDTFYIGGETWNKGSQRSCWPKCRNIIHHMLKDDVNEQCQLIIL
ncbi:uncharacterized protein [Cicer arietinum]|uniref:Uncharacterized protein LOC101490330 n=1 Tax=Cicer arietinum TaxID=3827 RepID=A0A1S2XDT3_CICAR|nr:uncharacterized protein LOC101490330 [Cicer arietinum]